MQKYFAEARQLLLLAIPVIIAQFSQTSMGVVDTILAGQYSAVDMAAVAVGTSVWLPAILFAHGLLQAMTPVIAQLNGAGRRDRIAHQTRQGYWLAGALATLLVALLYHSDKLLLMMDNVDPALVDIATRYIRALSLGAFGYLFFQVARNQCEGMARTKPGMVIGCIALLTNIPVNYICINGKLGVPAMGGAGCGVATAIVYWLMFVLMYTYTRKTRHFWQIRAAERTRFSLPDWRVLQNLIRLGFPVALAYFFEVTLFAVVSLLVSPLGVVNVDGHQIALNFSSLVFVFPMSVGIAATIRVGFRLGEQAVDGARVAAWTAQLIGISFAICTALFTITFRTSIAALYNDTPAVIALASSLMLLAAFYQISDAIQVVGSGILRGYKDTRSIFFITFIAYWLIGLPTGYLLGLTHWITEPMGPAGFWIGFILGLSAAALMMLFRIRQIQRQPEAIILQRAARSA